MAVRVPKSTRTQGGNAVEDELLELFDGPVEIEELLQHREALHSLCQRIVGDAATADDMVQETYLRALKNLDQLERRPSLMPWLTTVAKRRSIDELRSRKRVTPTDELPTVVAAASDEPESKVPASDTVRRVREALATLNERERRLLTRQVDDGLSLAELAEEDESSVDSVRSVLVRARAKLRDAIAPDIGFPVAAPLFALFAAARRRLQDLNLKAQRTFSTTPLERVGEVVTAGVVTIALGAAPTVVGGEFASAADQTGGTSAASDSTGASATVAGASVDAPASAMRPATPTGAIESLPGSAAVDLLLPPDDVERTSDAKFTSFAAGSSDGAVLAAGTRKQGCVAGCTVLFRSLDGGGSWERLPATGITGTTIAVAPGYPADPRVFAVGEEGLSISRDGGNTFAFVLPTGAGPLALAPAFGSGDERVFIGSGPALVWDEATRSATPLLGAPTSPTSRFAFEPGYPTAGSLLVGSSAAASGNFQAAVYRCRYAVSEDSCVESTVIPGIERPPSVAVIGRTGTALAWAGARMLRSTDRAMTFQAVNLPAGLHAGDVASDHRGVAFAAGYSASSGPAGVLRSTDDGRTWHVVGAGTPLVRGVATVVTLPGGRVLAAPLGEAGGDIYCSDDGGSTWSATCA